MTLRYQQLAFTDAVKAAQEANGSRNAYSRADGADLEADRLTENEVEFIATRDSFYLATVGADGWPYMQHRGGPPGFVKLLDDRTLAIADFRGNRQYVSLGNLAGDDRASLFFMDYARKARLKMLARVEAVSLADRPDLEGVLVDPDYGARVERAFLIHVEAFDWNCPQHITPRFTEAELRPAVAAMKARIEELEAQVSRMKAE